MSDNVVAEIQRDYIFNLAKDGKRVDGRAFDQYRPVQITTGMIDQAEGSARVKLGNTDVFAGVKMAIGTPYPDSPNDGTLTTSAELIPMASPDFETGPPRAEAIELARVVDRGIRESKCIDMGALCITPGQKIWMTYLDFHIVDYDGNLFDACSLAGIAALGTATVPAAKHKAAMGPEFADKNVVDYPMPMKEWPIMTTAMKVGNAVVFDPGLMEDTVGGPRLSVSYDRAGNIRAMQKGLEGGFTKDEIMGIVRDGQVRSAELREQLIKQTGISP
ncbi:MAG: exosome complex protein Rrp42 [Thermoplasmatota archaeon]